MNINKATISLVAATTLTLSLFGCVNEIRGEPIMLPESNNVVGLQLDDKYLSSSMDFSIEIFKKTYTSEINTLVSPLSIVTALALAANGADNETLKQMEHVLTNGLPIAEFNGYLYTYINSLPSNEKAKFHLANSIWFKDVASLKMQDDFLQTSVDYYDTSIFKEIFDSTTVSKVNSWVKENTHEMIDKIIDSIDSAMVTFLINALAFEAEWAKPYTLENINDDIFIDITGEKKDIVMMHSDESIYLENDKATGFIKPYANDTYSFVAILPNESVDFNDYVNQLDSKEIIDLLSKRKHEKVVTSLPKFEYDFSIKLSDTLFSMGMQDAFIGPKADFTKMAISDAGNIYISDVIHKTYIKVDELGTKAGAVTAIIMKSFAFFEESPKEVILDRPFIYMIVDNKTNLPIFIGTVITFSNK